MRTAATVRLCLSAISVMLFPASTISRSCLSSSGPHGRLVHDRSYRDWNRRTVIVECALQRSLGRNNNLAVELS